MGSRSLAFCCSIKGESIHPDAVDSFIFIITTDLWQHINIDDLGFVVAGPIAILNLMAGRQNTVTWISTF